MKLSTYLGWPNASAERANHPWLPEEDDHLKTMIAQRFTARKIGLELKRSTRSIRRRAEVMRFSWRASMPGYSVSEDKPRLRAARIPWTFNDDETLRTLAIKGSSVADIASKLDRTLFAIRNRAFELRISLGHRKNRNPEF